MNCELPHVQAGFRKGRGTRAQIANIHWITGKNENSRKTSNSALLTMPKPLTVWITTNWKIIQELGVQDHLTWLLRNLYAGQEAIIRIRHGPMDWFQIGKEYIKAIYCHPASPRPHPAYLTYTQGTSREMPGWNQVGREKEQPQKCR